jgi:hypothetical protein
MEHQLLEIGSLALKKAALNTDAKAFLLENEKLFKLIKKAADRYIGGENLEEALQKALAAHAQGLKCSLEYMGEMSIPPKKPGRLPVNLSGSAGRSRPGTFMPPCRSTCRTSG